MPFGSMPPVPGLLWRENQRVNYTLPPDNVIDTLLQAVKLQVKEADAAVPPSPHRRAKKDEPVLEELGSAPTPLGARPD